MIMFLLMLIPSPDSGRKRGHAELCRGHDRLLHRAIGERPTSRGQLSKPLRVTPGQNMVLTKLYVVLLL